MKLNSYENNTKNNYIYENAQEACNQSFVPIYDNYHLEPYFNNSQLNQNNINAYLPIIKEQIIQQPLKQSYNPNIKIITNQFDFTKASTKPDKSLDNIIIDNEYQQINESNYFANNQKEVSNFEKTYEKLKKELDK